MVSEYLILNAHKRPPTRILRELNWATENESHSIQSEAAKLLKMVIESDLGGNAYEAAWSIIAFREIF